MKGFTLSDPRDSAAMTAALVPVVAAKHSGYEELIAGAASTRRAALRCALPRRVVSCARALRPAGLVSLAVATVMPPAPKTASVNVDNVRVTKLIGGSITDSTVVKGVVVQRDTEGTIKRAERAKVAVFGCSIEAAAPETRGTVVIKTAEELMAYNKGEEKMMEEAIRSIAESGAKVVVAGGSVSEIALHYLEKYGLMIVKVLSKFELRRLCKAVNATALVRVGAPTPDELGYADLVAVQELSSRHVTVFKQDAEDSAVATIVLRGATMNVLDDVERAIDDAVNTAKQLCKDGRMVAGAGATEIELASTIAAFGGATPGLEQYAINKYAEALEVVPRILAENAGLDPVAVISELYAAHTAGGKGAGAGVDIDGDKPTKDAAAAGIWDSLAVKLSAMRLAADAAITILRVDTIIMAKQAGGPKPRAPGPADGGDDM